MAFLSDRLADYRRFRILNIVADYSKFCPGQIVDLSLPGARLARSKDGLSLALGSDQLAPLHGLPEEIVPGKVRIRRILSWGEVVRCSNGQIRRILS